MAQDSKYVIKLLTDEDIIAKSQGEVFNHKDYDIQSTSHLSNPNDFVRNRFVAGGLYDPSVFGLVGHCICNSVRVSPGEPSRVCSACGIKVVDSINAQAELIGHYILPYATVTPVKVPKLLAKLKENGYATSDEFSGSSEYDRLKFICSSSFKDGGQYAITDSTDPDTIGLDALYEIPEYRGLISKVIVIPSTAYRSCYPQRDKRTGNIVVNMTGDVTIGTQLSAILKFSERIRRDMPTSLTPMEYATIKFNYAWLLYCHYNSSAIVSGGKYHEVRDLTRSTIESSIRATISPCLDLDVNQIKVPRGLAYHALDADIKNELVENYGYTASSAIQEIKGNTKLANDVLEDIIAKKTVCLLWRNPSLHKNSVNAVFPVLWDEASIGIPIELCAPMNADFDGDQCGCSFITDPKNYDFIANNVTADKLLYYEKSNKPIYTPTHEVLVGLYLASSNQESVDKGKKFKDLPNATVAFEADEIEYDEIIKVGNRKDTYARFRLADIIGSDLDIVIGRNKINKGNIAKVISVIYSKSDYVKRLSKLKEFGVLCTTIHGIDIPFSQVYDFNDEKLVEILESDSTDSVKLDQFNDYIETSVKEQLIKLPNTNLSKLVEIQERIKNSVLAEMYAPTLKLDRKGKFRLEMENQFGGITESTFVARSLDNRKVQELKKGQVPMAGYITRQLVLANSSIAFERNKLSPDTVGLELKSSEAIGRTDLKGNIITEESDKLVRVKSCINHNQKKVFIDEVSKDYHINQGANISITLATAFSEFLTQSTLALKHGKAGGRTLTEDLVHAANAGIVQSITDRFMIILNTNNQEDKYFLNKSSRTHVRVGSEVHRGQVIIESNKSLRTGANLGKLCSLLGLGIINEYAQLKKDNPVSMCCTPIAGKSRFVTVVKNKKNGTVKESIILEISNGSKFINIDITDLDEVIFKPEGSSYVEGERVSTGVLDLSKYKDYVSDRITLFHKFKEQCQEIFGKVVLRSELYEVIFKSLESTMSVRKSIQSDSGDIDLLQRLYYGATKKALKSYFKKSDEIELEESLILSLLFNEGEET